MSSLFLVKGVNPETGEEETQTFEPDEFAVAFLAFMNVLAADAEHAELVWSA